jgi:hypothetical protein
MEQTMDASAISHLVILIMSKESDKISGHIGCLDTENILATLIATSGYHCEVWRSIGNIIVGGERQSLDIVIKKFRGPCSMREAEVYRKHYHILKEKLDDIIPSAIFVVTTIDDEVSVAVIAETIKPWFNIANPANEGEAIPLLRRLPKAQNQLQRFISAAHEWRTGKETRVIDLYGLDNLVLDTQREIKYVDSFGVFFNEDLLYLTGEVDESFKSKIELSLNRLEYLDHMLKEVRRSVKVSLSLSV